MKTRKNTFVKGETIYHCHPRLSNGQLAQRETSKDKARNTYEFSHLPHFRDQLLLLGAPPSAVLYEILDDGRNDEKRAEYNLDKTRLSKKYNGTMGEIGYLTHEMAREIEQEDLEEEVNETSKRSVRGTTKRARRTVEKGSSSR